MSLERLYPGDQILACMLVVVLAVTLLSTVALVLSQGLKARAALRHCVLLSALIGDLATPILAALWFAAGCSTVSLGWLPSARTGDRTIAPLVAESAQVVAPARGSFEAAPAAQAAKSSTYRASAQAEPGVQSSPVVDQAPTLPASAEPREPKPFLSNPRIEIAISAILVWLVGTLLLVLGVVRSYWAVRRIRRAIRPATDGRLPELLGEVCGRLGIVRRPTIVVSTRVLTPVVAGWIRPLVILPEVSLGLITREQLRDVLMHELAHVVRRDPLVLPLQLLAQALFWPIVVIHWLNRHLHCAREEACDNFVLATRDPLSYGETLLRLAELSRGAVPVVAGMGILHWRGTLEERIESLVSAKRDTRERAGRLTALASLGLFLTASGLLCGARIVAEQGSGAPAPTKAPKQAAQKTEALALAGRVLLPDGRPAAGARVQVDLYQFDSKRRGFPADLLKQWTPLASIITDSEGRFSQSIERDWKAEEHSRIDVTALAPGYGFATPTSFAPAYNRPLELKLVADEPVRGRVLDLQGRPVAGARLDIRRICCSTPRLVDRWLAALPPKPVFGGYGSVNGDEAPLMYGIGSTPHFPGGICTPSNAVIPVAMTDADGRFEILGLGRDRLIFFRLAGPSLATSEVRVLTRPGKELRFEHVVGPGQDFIYRSTFDFAAGPGTTLEGAVTDEDSSAPLGGVAIECQAAEGLWGGNQEFLSTTTDERGHYRIEGVNPIAKGTLKVVPEGPYLEMDYISLPKAHGLDPIRRDLRLRRGLWAVGRAFNLKTGQPVQGTLYYTPFRSNENAKRYARYTTKSMGMVSNVPFGQTDADGRFRIPVIPGRGVICLRTWDGHFRPGFGVAQIKELANLGPN